MPIFLGNLFQQLYNVVDSLVVGNVLGKEALAAVTSTGSLIFLIIGFIGGIFMGSGVIVSRYYGGERYEKMSVTIHTTMAFAFLAGLVIMAVGILGTPLFLRLVGTPDDVLKEATAYLRIYFAGGLAIVFYNACVGIFQAVGDSRRPLYYLMTAAITNVVLDIVFVAFLGMGVGGAALATVISQFLSAGLAFTKLMRVDAPYRVNLKKIRIDFSTLRTLLQLGIPSGVQNSVIAFANVIVQSNINAFGSMAMAGSGAYTKIEGFAFLPITSFSMALTTFVGQNLGARKFDRVREGSRFGILSGVALSQIIGILIWIFAPQLIAIFNKQPDVVAIGVERSRIISLFFFLLSTSHLLSGVLRGLGKTKVPMFVMLLTWCVIRIAYVTIVTSFIPDIRVIFWAYPLTWALSSAILIIYYKNHSSMADLAAGGFI